MSELLACSVPFYVLGLVGLILRQYSYIYMLISVELVVLGVILLFSSISIYYGASLPCALVLFVIGVAAAESVVGITLLLIYYRGYEFD